MAIHKNFIVAGIKMILERNYGFDTDKIDLWAMVDEKLTYRENWENVKEKINLNTDCVRCPNCNYEL